MFLKDELDPFASSWEMMGCADDGVVRWVKSIEAPLWSGVTELISELCDRRGTTAVGAGNSGTSGGGGEH